WIGGQILDNNNGWLEEDPEEEPEEEEIEDKDMVNDEEDDAEVINPYKEADPHNRPPPTSDEETEFAPPMVQIADADDVPLPPVIQFGSNFHVRESSATRDLLAGNSEVYAPGLMCCNLKSVHRGVIKLSKQMHDRYKTKMKMARKLRQDKLRMNGQEFDITALDLVVKENRPKNSKMMKLITDQMNYKRGAEVETTLPGEGYGAQNDRPKRFRAPQLGQWSDSFRFYLHAHNGWPNYGEKRQGTDLPITQQYWQHLGWILHIRAGRICYANGLRRGNVLRGSRAIFSSTRSFFPFPLRTRTLSLVGTLIFLLPFLGGLTGFSLACRNNIRICYLDLLLMVCLVRDSLTRQKWRYGMLCLQILNGNGAPFFYGSSGQEREAKILRHICKQGYWFSFEKIVGKGAGGQIFQETFSGLKGWERRFLFLDRRAIPDAMAWRHHDSDINDYVLEDGFSEQDVQTLAERVIDLRPVPLGLFFQGGLATTWDFPRFHPVFKGTEGNGNAL
nr:hypothetical protein [Tanacetum cinerariifolium]